MEQERQCSKICICCLRTKQQQARGNNATQMRNFLDVLEESLSWNLVEILCFVWSAQRTQQQKRCRRARPTTIAILVMWRLNHKKNNDKSTNIYLANLKEQATVINSPSLPRGSKHQHQISDYCVVHLELMEQNLTWYSGEILVLELSRNFPCLKSTWISNFRFLFTFHVR